MQPVAAPRHHGQNAVSSHQQHEEHAPTGLKLLAFTIKQPEGTQPEEVRQAGM